MMNKILILFFCVFILGYVNAKNLVCTVHSTPSCVGNGVDVTNGGCIKFSLSKSIMDENKKQEAKGKSVFQFAEVYFELNGNVVNGYTDAKCNGMQVTTFPIKEAVCNQLVPRVGSPFYKCEFK